MAAIAIVKSRKIKRVTRNRLLLSVWASAEKFGINNLEMSPNKRADRAAHGSARITKGKYRTKIRPVGTAKVAVQPKDNCGA